MIHHGDRCEQSTHGEPTPEEARLGHRFFDPDSEAARSEAYWEREDLEHPNERHIEEVAAAWGVAPHTLADSTRRPGVGWVGRLREGAF